MSTSKEHAIILMHCPDQQGIVAAVSRFIDENQGNVISLDQHVDGAMDRFFMRVSFEIDGFLVPKDKLKDYFDTLVAQRYDMTFELHFDSKAPRMALFVSKMSHCLYDILSRWQSGEWKVEIPMIISNHENLERVAKQFDIPYHYLPVTKENKKEVEAQQMALMKEYKCDFAVLARYMQIIPPAFIRQYPNRIINIHHSFLPAFVGAKPYHAAHDRGVKIIGATSHYVTEDLDAGPIIEQDVAKVSHKDEVADLIRKGKDLEKIVLSRAIRQHIMHKLIVFKNKTVIFD
ncbi:MULTISPECIES: formyltetrahydrofolate deformylase [Persicobacter]|uniref:Formyltetrahydrofolate deformylase n=1 Tax=Persicobacter diffluens TaxID=981 RepID=A0AAN4VXV9_9BACT|nr:formyltetrahydrofolate deformylase [Persicobacter sp. CCB-QB2]GJM61718.1 formyltetrahydrofolate deformylase [Persicobacter diffluens]